MWGRTRERGGEGGGGGLGMSLHSTAQVSGPQNRSSGAGLVRSIRLGEGIWSIVSVRGGVMVWS